MVMSSLRELRMRERRAVPTIAVRAPRALAVSMRRLYSEVWRRLLRLPCVLLSELFGGVSEGVHAEPFFFRDGLPWLSKRRGEWACG